MSRTPTGGRIDRRIDLRFRFDGRDYLGHPGDTLASALLANGVHRIATSISYHRPRGIVAAGVEEASALVQLDAPFPEPMVTASTVELYDGLVAHGLAGRGALGGEDDPARYDAMHAHCDVLVVGGGPAGLMAARTVARAGARLILLDDQPEAGGSLLAANGGPPGWVASAAAELADQDAARILHRTSAFGCYDDGFVLALQKRTDHLGNFTGRAARQRVWRIRASQVILATGAHERPIVFADNDRPGIMLAGAARTFLNRYAVLPGSRVVLFTTNDGAYSAALDLAAAGAAVTIIDPRPVLLPELAGRCAQRGVTVRLGHVVTGSHGDQQVTAALVAAFGNGLPGSSEALAADLVLVSGGWNPTVHLYSQARGKLSYDAGLDAFVPAGTVSGVRVAGAAAGQFGHTDCLVAGTSAAVAALAELGVPSTPIDTPQVEHEAAEQAPMLLWAVPEDPTRPSGHRFVDFQRDATVSDVLRATGAGLRSVEHVKRYTTIGTAHDQGKTSGLIASGILADALGVDIATLGTTTYRPPYTSVSFAALAGRDRGELFDPVRLTALHSWHVEHGAAFENVGQWKRPWYYPQHDPAGAVETIDAAVLRECRAARTGVAMMDASTLGKIIVQGSDAAEFLDRLYTNVMGTLRVGSIRYGVMCGLDGMIIDDGTVTRVSPEEFLVTTTTGNAAMVLDWMEEFSQTEWPALDVFLTSVTEQWATVALVGPAARVVLAAVAPALAVSNGQFGFMTWRPADIGGVSARVCRISFSGELAYEINVPAWYGQSLWEAVYEAGQLYGITPYGTETMHVLRAEKGYPIIGQDTDGTVTPQDLGLGWVVSKKKPDFVGKRSFSRPENMRPDRKHLVGLLPLDRGVLLAEGGQVLSTREDSVLPVPMLGHVTSSYRSAVLERTFALALVRSGRDRIGDTVWVWHDGDVTAAEVVDAVLYDKAGERRDG